MIFKKLALSVLMLGFAINGHSQNEATVHTGLIEVMGEASISLAADYAEIQIATNQYNTEAKVAHEQATRDMAKAIDYLKKNKAVSDVRTTRVVLNERYNGNNTRGYNASLSLTFRLNDLSKYDEVILGLIGVGVNGINNVSFKSSQAEKSKDILIQQAMQNARNKAELMAAEYGQTVGRAMMISDRVGSSNPSPIMEYRKASFDMAGPSTEGGSIELSTTVNVQFELK